VWLSHGICSYVCVYINAIAGSVTLCLQHDFYNMLIKIKPKLYTASGSAPPTRKNSGCALGYHASFRHSSGHRWHGRTGFPVPRWRQSVSCYHPSCYKCFHLAVVFKSVHHDFLQFRKQMEIQWELRRYTYYAVLLTFQSSNPGRGKGFSSSPKRRDQLWGAPALLFSGCCRSFTWVKRPSREFNHLPPSSSGAVPLFPCMFSCRRHGKLL
jgi:hypothetical protein